MNISRLGLLLHSGTLRAIEDSNHFVQIDVVTFEEEKSTSDKRDGFSTLLNMPEEAVAVLNDALFISSPRMQRLKNRET